MQLSWRDSFDRLDPKTWRGLRLSVENAKRPRLAVSVSRPRCIRISIDRTSLLWARVDDDHCGYELLRASDVKHLGILPPISAELVAEHRDAISPLRAWARTFAKLLMGSAHSALYDGQWRLGSPVGFSAFALSAAIVQQVVAQKASGYIQWDWGDTVYPITLRDVSAREAGRVKVWRKQVGSDSLPPVLLYWVSGLDAYVVLDGHDRLLAAAIEHAPAPALALDPLRECPAPDDLKAGVVGAVEKSLIAAERRASSEEQLARVQRPFTVEHANRLLLDAFSPAERLAPTRAFPIHGGREQWASEVRAELVRRGITDTGLLDA